MHKTLLIIQHIYDQVVNNSKIIEKDRCISLMIILWHLRKDSILVKVGDVVKAGDPLAKVGNSGICHAPHLHIHAAKRHFLYGEGVPVTYDSRNPIKNRIFRK
ncbi:MAG: M23 family metallopeptidase [Clostridiaceae bacterium]|nr:M23 family metallopeptidase [Clostridiaceae bacterium]